MRLAFALLLALALGCEPHERVPIGHDNEGLGGQSGQAGQPGRAGGAPRDCEIAALDSSQLSALGPSDRSHWLQPWRAYRDTWPAVRMRSAPGYQPAFPPDPSWLPFFSGAGFKRVTLEVGWGRQAYDTPEGVTSELRDALGALAEQAAQAGLRPLLMLNAPNTFMPARSIVLNLTEAASTGARSVRFSPADAAQLTAHRALLTPTTPSLVSSVGADGLVQLARPLPQDLPAGPTEIKLLRYAPFSRPTLADGSPNPAYEDTLSGWLAFLNAAAGAMRDALGSQAFDVELWNETASGNNFYVFDINTLYDPSLEADRTASFDENLNAIRERSVAFLRAPERDLEGIGIADGSGNMRFAVTSASEPRGVTALSRHLSAQGRRFPEEADLGATPSLDALGEPNGALDGASWVEAFTPSYSALFPEQSLTALYPPDARRPPQIVRDLAPVSSLDSRGNAHQRAALEDGVPLPDVWLTAASTNLGLADVLGIALSPEDRLHLQAKAIMRTFSSYVGAGVGVVSIYGPNVDTVGYFDLAQPAGGEVLASLGRFFARFADNGAIAEPRALDLLGIANCAPETEFEGDGSAAHPSLEHRQLVAAFPFQTGPRSFVMPTYVMTRNLLRERPGVTGITRFDLAPEHFELRLAGLDTESAQVTAFDPLLNTAREVSIVSKSGSELVIALDLTDYPVLLELQD